MDFTPKSGYWFNFYKIPQEFRSHYLTFQFFLLSLTDAAANVKNFAFQLQINNGYGLGVNGPNLVANMHYSGTLFLPFEV